MSQIEWRFEVGGTWLHGKLSATDGVFGYCVDNDYCFWEQNLKLAALEVPVTGQLCL